MSVQSKANYSLSLLWVIPAPVFQKLIDLIDIHFLFYPIIYSFIGIIYHLSSYYSHFQKASLYPEPPFTKYLTYRISFIDIFFLKTYSICCVHSEAFVYTLESWKSCFHSHLFTKPASMTTDFAWEPGSIWKAQS